MKTLLIFVCLLSLLSCNNQHRAKNADVTENKIIDIITDSTECESIEDTTYRETLNDIRFAGWTSKEWADNEYIREVRRFIDAYNRGEFEDPYLDVDKAWSKLQKLSTRFGSEDFYSDEDMEYDEEYYESYHEDADDYEVLDDDYYEEYDDDEDSDKIEDNACKGH